MLAALAFGGLGAVGSSYNFAAPMYLRLIRAFETGDWPPLARSSSRRAADRILCDFGYMAAAKAVMGMLGVRRSPRLPNAALAPGRHGELEDGLARMDSSTGSARSSS